MFTITIALLAIAVQCRATPGGARRVNDDAAPRASAETTNASNARERRQTAHLLVTSGSCTDPILTRADCVAAAVALGLSDNTATNDRMSSSSYPPGCYLRSRGSLMFNGPGGNTGVCSSDHQCLCRTVTHLK